jgi:hypothetical protein
MSFALGSGEMDELTIIRAHPRLVEYVDGLQRKNATELSFYPRQVFERERDKGRIFLSLLNNDPCGYAYVGLRSQDMKCHQICIQYDARRRLYGAHLVGTLEQYALDGDCASITLRCAYDLEANQFWQSLGYSVIGIVDGGARRMRKINVWRKQLSPELFAAEFIEPAKGKMDATLWRRHKQTGMVTQFVRGKAMAQYRARLIGVAGAGKCDD